MANNVMDLLLKSDTSKIKIPTKQVKIQSLSEAFGEDVIFTLQAISPEKYNFIQESGMKEVEDDIDIDTNKIQMLTVIEGIKEPNLKSEELAEHFKAHTPIELLQRMFTGKPGEIALIYKEIQGLCGFGKKVVEEVKN